MVTVVPKNGRLIVIRPPRGYETYLCLYAVRHKLLAPTHFDLKMVLARITRNRYAGEFAALSPWMGKQWFLALRYSSSYFCQSLSWCIALALVS